MKVKVQSKNLDQIVAGLVMLVNRIPIAAKQSSRLMAEGILNDSKTIPPMCPVDTGDLESTGHVEPVSEGYAVVYGGSSESGKFVDYAAYVHDDLRARKYKKPGSGPKFVEAHVLRRADEAPEHISDILQELVDDMERTYR